MLQFLNIEGSLFTFLFCFLCPIVLALIHSDNRNVVDSLSFSVLFVRACSPTSSECPSMFWALSFISFSVFRSKGSCFSIVICLCTLTHLVLHVHVFLWCVFNLQKLLLHPPLLFQLSALRLGLWLWCCSRLCLVILVVFLCQLFHGHAHLVFHLPSLCLSHLNF